MQYLIAGEEFFFNRKLYQDRGDHCFRKRQSWCSMPSGEGMQVKLVLHERTVLFGSIGRNIGVQAGFA